MGNGTRWKIGGPATACYYPSPGSESYAWDTLHLSLCVIPKTLQPFFVCHPKLYLVNLSLYVVPCTPLSHPASSPGAPGPSSTQPLSSLARLDTCVTVVDAAQLVDNLHSLQTLKVWRGCRA